MTRWSLIATFLAVGLAGYSGGHLALTLTGPGPDADIQTAALPLSALEAAPKASSGSSDWPEIFGSFVPDAPEPEVAPEAPPVLSRSYILKGIKGTGPDRWAIVTDGSGEILLRVGDILPGDTKVSAIDETGVMLETSAGQELIGFE